MKNKILKLTVAIAAVILLTAALAVAVVAEIYTGECGENVTYTLDTETGVLKIEGTGAMTDYSYFSPWYSNGSYVKNVEIADGVTSIGEHAFCHCSSLTSIEIPNSVTSIGSGAFLGCHNLTEITLPNGITSIGDDVFSNCLSLTSVTIPDSVTSIGEATFMSCSSLTKITIPEGVTRIAQQTFSGCTGLTSITIPKNVTRIDWQAFEGCTGLTTIIFKAKDTIIDSNAFDGCTSLETIYLCNNSYADNFFSDSEYTKFYPGDVYLDGVIDIKDLVLLNDYFAERIDEIDLYAADANGDGTIDVKDAVFLSQHIGEHPLNIDDFLKLPEKGEMHVPEQLDDPDAPKITFEGKQTGNLFEVTISVENNTDARGIFFTLNYYYQILKLINAEYKSDFGFMSCFDPETEYECQHPLVFCSAQRNKPYNGVIATLMFEVLDTSWYFEDIDYDNLFFAEFDTTSADFEFVNFSFESTIEYTINFVSKVGQPEAQIKLCNKPLILPDITAKVEGAKFMGWSLQEGSEYASYAPGEEFTLNRSVTLYAVWKDTVQYYFDEETGHLYIGGEGEIYGVKGLCTADTLKSLYIDDGITSIHGRCFNGYSNLSDIYITDTVEFIGELAFDGTAYYKDESNWDEDGVLYINNHLVAAKTTLSGEYRIRENTRSLSNSAFCDCRELKDVYIPGTVKTIYPGSFVGCYGLRKIFFGEGVETIKANVFMMSGPKNLSLIVIPKSVTMIEDEGNSFYEEYFAFFSVPTIYVHQDSNLSHNFGDAEIVRYSDSGDCGNGVTWEFDFVTGLLTFTGSGAIVAQGNSWRSLTDFITEVHIDIAITEIGNNVFKDCTKLEYVYFHYSDEFGGYWTYMHESNLVSIGNDAFNNCTSLHWLGDFPSTLKTIGDRAFKNFWSAQDCFDNFGQIESIGTEAFYGCRNIDWIDLTNCTTVGDKAFFDSSAFYVIIGEKLTQIGKSAFAWCYQLDGFDVDYNNPNYSSYNGYLYNKDATELICVPAHMYVCDILDSVTNIRDFALAQPKVLSLTLPENARITSDRVFKAPADDNVYMSFYATVLINQNYVSKSVLEGLVGTVIGDIVYYDETHSGTCGDNMTWTLYDIQHDSCSLMIEGSGEMWDFYEEHAPWWNYRHLIRYIYFDGEITSIGACAFVESNAYYVYFPYTLESIGDCAFQNCEYLWNADFENSNIKHIGVQAFEGTRFSEVILNDGIESIGDVAFGAVFELEIIYIPESVKEIGACICTSDIKYILLHKGSYADEYFSGNEFFSQKVIYVDEAYGECGETISWRFDWDSGRLIISGSGAFEGYDHTEEAPWKPYENFIRHIVIEEGITHVGNLGLGALWNITVWFPKSVTSMDEYLINACWNVYVYTNSYAAKCFPDLEFYGTTLYLDGKCGKDLKFFYDYMEDILTISGSGEMYDYEYWAAPWAHFDPSTVFISEGVTSIANFAFVHSSRLENLYVPKSVTKLPNPEYEGHFGYDNDYSVFCIYLHEGSYADEYFKENYDYTIKYLSVLENEEGVSIIGEAGTDYPENTEITVEVVDDEVGDIVIEGHSDKTCALDITLVCDGVETQPNDTIFVRIKVPQGFNGKKCKVYHRTDDGQLVDMDAVYEDGYLVFATDHFSVYVVAELLAADSGDLNGDGAINATDSVLLAQHLASWDVEIDLDAADCNGDGTVNAADSVLLAQYLANWDVTLG